MKNLLRRFIPKKGHFRLHPRNRSVLQVWAGIRWKEYTILRSEENDLQVFNPEIDFREGDKNKHERNPSNPT